MNLAVLERSIGSQQKKSLDLKMAPSLSSSFKEPLSSQKSDETSPRCCRSCVKLISMKTLVLVSMCFELDQIG